MPEALHFINSNSAEFVIGLTILSVFLFLYCVCLSRRVARFTRRRGQKPPGESVGEITDCLADHSEAIAELRSLAKDLSAKLSDQAATLQSCLQRIGLVRFNAFDDVGGEQSFALVLLDANGDGVAVSSIYGRQDSRLYAKAITKADGERPLSDEEKAALHNALAGCQLVIGAPSTPR